MKKIFVVLFICAIGVLCGCATPPPTRDQLHVEYNEITSLDKGKAFDIIERWIAINVKNSAEVIQLKNRDAGIIVLKPTYRFSIIGIDYQGHTTLEINVSDNKVRFSYDIGQVEYINNQHADDGVYPRIRFNELRASYLEMRNSMNADLGIQLPPTR